jgi:hypothetical protein
MKEITSSEYDKEVLAGGKVVLKSAEICVN